MMMSLPLSVVLCGLQIEQSLVKVGSCTWTDSLVHCWLTAAADESCLQQRLGMCLNTSQTDVTLACLSWLEASCDIAQQSTSTQLLIQVGNVFFCFGEAEIEHFQ